MIVKNVLVRLGFAYWQFCDCEILMFLRHYWWFKSSGMSCHIDSVWKGH